MSAECQGSLRCKWQKPNPSSLDKLAHHVFILTYTFFLLYNSIYLVNVYRMLLNIRTLLGATNRNSNPNSLSKSAHLPTKYKGKHGRDPSIQTLLVFFFLLYMLIRSGSLEIESEEGFLWKWCIRECFQENVCVGSKDRKLSKNIVSAGD